ncbi:MAG: PepSY-associated TM helix domain-containing protein [Pseudomonadota bacterium]
MFLKIRLVHAWSGLVLSLLVAVLSLSGSALIFKDDYLRATFPAARLGVDLSPAVVGSALESIERQLGSQQLSYVALAHQDMALHKIVLRDGRAAYALQTGQLIARWEENGRPEDWVFHLHHYLFMGDFGKYLAGVAALCVVLMAVSGIYLVLPFLRAFRWRLWPRSTKRRDLLGHHRDVGVVFLLPIVLIVLTGGAMVFFEQASSVLATLTMSQPTPFVQPEAQDGDVDWPIALERTRAQFPDAQLRLVVWPRATNSPASIRMRLPSEWHQNGRTYAYIDPLTSEVLAIRDATKLTSGERAANAIYPLHSTGIGGRPYDLLAGLTGIALSVLGLFASWSYLKLLRQRRANARPSDRSNDSQPSLT